MKKCKFENISFEKKNETIDEGRPLPEIDLFQKTKSVLADSLPPNIRPSTGFFHEQHSLDGRPNFLL